MHTSAQPLRPTASDESLHQAIAFAVGIDVEASGEDLLEVGSGAPALQQDESLQWHGLLNHPDSPIARANGFGALKFQSTVPEGESFWQGLYESVARHSADRSQGGSDFTAEFLGARAAEVKAECTPQARALGAGEQSPAATSITVDAKKPQPLSP